MASRALLFSVTARAAGMCLGTLMVVPAALAFGSLVAQRFLKNSREVYDNPAK